MEVSRMTLSLVTDTASPSQWSPLSAQNFDLGYTSESRGSSPQAVPGSLPTILGDTSKHETSLADDGDSALSTPQELGDRILGGLGQAAEYFVVLATQGLRNSSPSLRDILLALSEIRRSHSNVWPSLSKFALVERDRLLTPVVVT
jgi:hypothetical protein